VEGAKTYGLTPEELAEDLLFRGRNVPVQDIKGQASALAPWVPSTRLGDGLPGPVMNYPLMILGKAPGVEETQQGRLFCGPAGAVLRDSANRVGLGKALEEAYATNVLRFMPLDGGKTLKPGHIKDCLPLLVMELLRVRPRYLLVLGSDAVKVVFGRKATLERVRSRVFLMDDILGLGRAPLHDTGSVDAHLHDQYTRVFATIHPAACLRESGLTSGLDADLTRFAAVMGGHVSNPVPGAGCDYRYENTAAGVARSVDEALMTAREVAIDCEWGGARHMLGSLRTVQFSWAPRKACVAILRTEGMKDACSIPEQRAILGELGRLVSAPGMQVVGHNLRADALWLESLGIHVMERLSFDTMLADHALNENVEHGLDACAIRYTDMGRYDWPLQHWRTEKCIGDKRLQREGYAAVPDAILHPYGAGDADATLRIKHVLAAMLSRPEHAWPKACYERVIMPANQPIHEIESRGMFADKERMLKLAGAYEKRRDELEAGLKALVGRPEYNFRSPQQNSKLLFGPRAAGGLGLVPVKSTSKPAVMWEDVLNLPPGKQRYMTPSTDDETLEALSPHSPIVKALRDVKLIDQVIKVFLRAPETDPETGKETTEEGLIAHIDPDGRIRTSMSQMAETGRWKSSRPNLQNLPSRQDQEFERVMGEIQTIRSCFMAEAGKVLIASDYKSAELIGLGYLSNCPKLIRDVAGDLHARGAVSAMGAEAWDGYDELKPPPKAWLDRFKSLRIARKTVNFGIPYQRGAKAIAREIETATKGAIRCGYSEAQEMIDGFYADYPEVESFVDMCKAAVLDPGYLRNPFGRMRRFHVGRHADESLTAALQREAVNFPIQSVVADALNVAVYNLWAWRQLYPGRARYDIVLGVHDATLLEAPGEYARVLVEEVLPQCMSHGVEVPAWLPEGARRPTQPFHLDIDTEVSVRWGESASAEELSARGVDKVLIEKLA
jgi:uracil-DNA glycosylase family 4